MTQLTRAIEVLKTFPLRFEVGSEWVTLAAYPRLLLTLDLLPRDDQTYGVRYEYDVNCELQLKRDPAQNAFTAMVAISTSRQWPAGEAVVVAGKELAKGLDLYELDNVICGTLTHDEVWKRHGEAIQGLIQRWVTEYSLRSIASLTDFEVANALRTRSPDFYNEILNYVAAIDVTSPEIVRTYVRTALVNPDAVRETMKKNPMMKKIHSEEMQDLMSRTVELQPNRKLKNVRKQIELGVDSPNRAPG